MLVGGLGSAGAQHERMPEPLLEQRIVYLCSSYSAPVMRKYDNFGCLGSSINKSLLFF